MYISFANGGGGARGFSVSAGDKTLLADGSMESTAAWTTWKVQSIEVELPQGYSELKFTSLSKDGMANIDYIGWTSSDLKAGKVEISPTSIGVARKAPQESANRYFVNFRDDGKSTGVYFMRKNGKVFRVNGVAR